MKKLSCLSIEGMEFYAHHGCFIEERTIGTWFEADIYMYVDTTEARETDNLEAAVNYAEVYGKIKEEMNIPSKLIEHVAGRIARRVLNDYPKVEKVRIKVAKRNPPLGERIGRTCIEIEKER